QAEDGIRYFHVTGVQTCALPICRRAKIVEAVERETGIDETMVARLVHGFYDRVRADEVLAPIFNARIADWGPHLERMCDFWSSKIGRATCRERVYSLLGEGA